MVELPRWGTVTVWTSLLIILPGMAVHGQRRMQDSATSRIRRLASRGRDHHSFVPYLRATPGQRAMAADLRQAGHRERQAPGHSARPRTARLSPTRVKHQAGRSEEHTSELQ